MRMPFGLKNAGAVYCRLVASIMADLGLDSVAYYLDDVLIHTNDMNEHLDAIDQVLRAHLEAGIRLKPSKTLFFQECVDFLGFEVSGAGIKPTKTHTKTIQALQSPTTGKQVASTLGFLQYYREFIPEFSRLTEKMNGLRNKREITPEDWTPEIEADFRKMINLFLTPGGPVRHFPIPLGQPGGGEFILHIDWSKLGMAGVLYQRQHAQKSPAFIGAAGRKTTSYEANYHSSKGELAAMNFAFKKFEHFLKQGSFLVRTDNTTVLHWETMKDPGGTIRRWLHNFSYYNFRIEHRAGTELVDADFISRQTNLPDPTASEAEETEEMEPTFLLPKPLDQFQDLVALVVVGGSCGQNQCQPGLRCDPCLDAIGDAGMCESARPARRRTPTHA